MNRCTYPRVDLTHTYHSISRKEEAEEDLYILIYEYIILLFCSEICRIYTDMLYTKLEMKLLILIVNRIYTHMYVLEFN